MRNAILFSIAISQVGFVCAYTAFTAENLGAFIKAVTNGRVQWDISWLIMIQLIVFLPLSMIRDISKLGFTALIADFFILLGLVYLYYADISTILDRGVADIVLFNGTDWTLFIGTAIFTFEGIGLIIPITQSMKEPEKFPAALGGVMLFITILFTSIGALSYAAFGSSTKTVILSNLPQSNRFVNAVQLLYSIAILLSTPLQLFPAIRILETALFTKSGKYSPKTKWTKNMFRIFIVISASFFAWVGANDLDKFVSLIGSFACVPLVFIYPPLLHLKGVSQTRAQKGADVALAIFGVLAMIYTTATSISSWVS
jgi:proton-coupled amino acid transporter